MLGSTELTSILGCGVDSTNHEAVRQYIRAACDSGLAVMLIIPESKAPFDGRTPRKRNADDKAAREHAKAAGIRHWAKVKSKSGLELATTDKNVLTKKGGYLDRYIEVFGDDVAVNLAVEVGRSRLVIVDCDTNAQREKFLSVAEAPSDLPPTVQSPGSRDVEGEWVHEPGNGHYWFTLPEGVELPHNTGSLTWSGGNGFAVLWDQRYVLIPPSRRPEGAYEMVGRDYPAPPWLIEAIEARASVRLDRSLGAEPADPGMATEIDEWSESVSWGDILAPLGWSPTARTDNCGCEVWTAPGPHHSPKSATTHDSGCSLGRYTECNAPLHIWTDNPGEPFEEYIAANGTKTLSKLQAVAYTSYGGDVGKAMDDMGISPSIHTIERETGVDPRSIDDTVAGHDPSEPIEVSTSRQAGDFEVHVDGELIATGGVGKETVLVDADTKAEIEAIEQDAEDGQFEPFVLEQGAGIDFPDDVEDPDPDVFDTGVQGVPVIAPFSYWRDTPAPEYVIDGLIEHGGLACLIGPPGVGKSVVALDMACCIATGKPWQGRSTLKTKVLYLPGEGHPGAIQRVKAWAAKRGVPEDDMDSGLRIGDSIIQLGASTEAWGLLAEYIIRQQIGLIIFDTFARMSLGIEENSATEVGRAVVRFDQIRRLTNAGVLIVHHTAKNNPSSGRGSSALNGALDSELLVSDGLWDFEQFGMTEDFPDGKKIQMTTTKQKNAEQLDDPLPMMLRNYEPIGAPVLTGANGELDPMVGDIVLARPVPEPVVETAIRLRTFAVQFTAQGVTRADMVAGVRPDPHTAMRKDAAKAWRQKVAVALDRALRYGLLETVSGERLGARYESGPTSNEEARRLRAAEVLSEGEADQ